MLRKIYKGMIMLVLILCLGCKEQIVHNLNETDANRLLTKLNETNIDAEKVKQPDARWAIAVSKSEAIKAIKFLSDSRVFKDVDDGTPERSSIISSREDQRFKYERALSREIENTVASILGVLEARVHLNLPRVDPLFGQPIDASPGSASVLIIAEQNTRIEPADIALLVSGASGVARNNISVLVTRSSAAVKNTIQNSALPLTQLSQTTESKGVKPEAEQTGASKAEEASWLDILKGNRQILIQAALFMLLLGGVFIYFAFFARTKNAFKI